MQQFELTQIGLSATLFLSGFVSCVAEHTSKR